jgi:hypothetical protein
MPGNGGVLQVYISSDGACVAFGGTAGPPSGLTGLTLGIIVVPQKMGRR